MEEIKKISKKMILILFILFITYAIFFPVRAYSVGDTSKHLYANIIEGEDGCKNWFCIESNQSVANYFDGYTWKLIKKITKTSDDGNEWHLMGRIAYWCSYNNKVTFDWHHDVNHIHVSESYRNAGQAMMWKLLEEYEDTLSSNLGYYTAGTPCKYCSSYSTADKNSWLNDGYKYTVNIDLWDNQDYPAQKLIRVTAEREEAIKPVTLEFYKTKTDGTTGIPDAVINFSKENNVKTLSNSSLKSLDDGRFGILKVTPNSGNSGTFKIGVKETAVPNNCLGIPNDVVLTVAYNNGEVTRNKSRNKCR